MYFDFEDQQGVSVYKIMCMVCGSYTLTFVIQKEHLSFGPSHSLHVLQVCLLFFCSLRVCLFSIVPQKEFSWYYREASLFIFFFFFNSSHITDASLGIVSCHHYITTCHLLKASPVTVSTTPPINKQNPLLLLFVLLGNYVLISSLYFVASFSN